MSKIKSAIIAVVNVLDGRDVVLGVGLTLIAVGVWPLFQPAALIVPGVVLTYVAIFGVRG